MFFYAGRQLVLEHTLDKLELMMLTTWTWHTGLWLTILELCHLQLLMVLVQVECRKL